MQCDGCGDDFEEKELKEMKFFGQRNYYCRECINEWKG